VRENFDKAVHGYVNHHHVVDMYLGVTIYVIVDQRMPNIRSRFVA